MTVAIIVAVFAVLCAVAYYRLRRKLPVLVFEPVPAPLVIEEPEPEPEPLAIEAPPEEVVVPVEELAPEVLDDPVKWPRDPYSVIPAARFRLESADGVLRTNDMKEASQEIERLRKLGRSFAYFMDGRRVR
jgi:hypothetical protein